MLNKSGCKETNAKARGDKSNYNHLSDESKNVCILTDMKTSGIQLNGQSLVLPEILNVSHCHPGSSALRSPHGIAWDSHSISYGILKHFLGFCKFLEGLWL